MKNLLIISAIISVLASTASASDYFNSTVQPSMGGGRYATMQNPSRTFVPSYQVPHYNTPHFGNNGVGEGALGYNGETGKVDRRYIPGGSDPNPSVDVMGGDKLGYPRSRR